MNLLPKRIVVLGAEFTSMLANFRILWLAGRFGGGKTALATILAAWLCWSGYADDIITNYPCDLANPAPRPPLRRTVLVVDEAWEFARDSRAVERYAGFLRKLGNYVLLPSVFPVHHRFSFFWVERFFSGYVVGLPLWVWRWNLTRQAYRDKGYFLVVNPHLIFPHFDTYAITREDGGVASLLEKTVDLLAPEPAKKQPKDEKRNEQLSLPIAEAPPLAPPLGASAGGDLRSAAEEIADSVGAFQQVAGEFADTIDRLRHLRRR
jgi:hypothetical protein